MARPERFELPTAWFVARYSIQLSYGREKAKLSRERKYLSRGLLLKQNFPLTAARDINSGIFVDIGGSGLFKRQATLPVNRRFVSTCVVP